MSPGAAAEESVAPGSTVSATSNALAFTVAPPANFVFLATTVSTNESSSVANVATNGTLPDAPQPVMTTSPEPGAFLPGNSTGGTAPKYAQAIPSGWSAQHLSGGDKVVLGFRNLFSPTALAGTIIGSGYSHLTDGQPNYGVDGTAFAQRFGAGMARSASQTIFTTSIMSPILHQDTRYYVLGPQASFVHRVVYAATRPLIGRTDGGHATINASLLIGYAGAAALTRTYYPPINQNFTDEARTFGSSLGGAAIGFAFDEFSDQLLKAIHMHHGN